MITDPTLVIDAPVSYFIAGLADTLAKWYESETILAQPQLQHERFSTIGWLHSQTMRERDCISVKTSNPGYGRAKGNRRIHSLVRDCSLQLPV